MDKEKLSTLIHGLVGAGVGFLSSLLGKVMYIAFAAVIILYVTGRAAESVAEREDFKWWVGNGVVPFVFLWLVTWVFLFNI